MDGAVILHPEVHNLNAVTQQPVDWASLSDTELVEQTRAGQEAAFRELVNRYEPRVAATVIGMLGRGQEAEDVGQETFIRCYQSLGRFRGDASLGTYLTRIAMNLSLNAIKRRKRQRWRFVSRDGETDYPLPEPAFDGEAWDDARERRRLVHTAIEKLPPKHRAVVVLRIIEGFSTQETADILDIPLGTVLSRLSRAQSKLKDLLGPYIQADGR